MLIIFINELKSQFKENRFHAPNDMDDIWQLLYPEHFINVLLVHHIKQRREEDIEKIASIMRHGLKHYDDRPLFQFSEYLLALHDDQHYYKKFKTSKISDMFESFQSEDGSTIKPKRILIDGAPGMGKTTLCKEIAYQWAKGELLTNSKIVFLLFLRDPAIQKIHDLKDFIHYFYKFEPSHGDTSKKCAEILKERDNSDITIVMDGYDEYSDKDDLLITKIIKRQYIPQCRIVITSRPIASEKLQKLADVRVEILGFTEKSRREYIQKELKDYPTKIKTFLSYLDNHSSINELCCIPIMMTIMVCCFKQYEELPTNETEVYERFVTLAISHCLQRIDGNLPTKILSLNKLPEEYQENLKQLSEFAFKTIESDRIIFSNEDMERLSPTLALSSSKNQGLGLFKVTEHLNTIKMDRCIWYNFLHLSIQEFLAAYYLKSLEPYKQFQILNKHFFITRYTNVWVTFLGLQQNETYHFDQYLAYTHTSGASVATKSHIKFILQSLQRLSFSTVKNININGIKGTFQLLCYKDEDSIDDHQTDHENLLTQIDSWRLFQTSLFLFEWSTQTTLFASFCSVENNDQLIEIFLLDKKTSNTFYYKVVRGLEENQTLSVLLLSSDTLVAYRSKFRQLDRALNINRPLQCLILRYCIMNSNTAHVLSSCILNSSYLRDLHIVNCKFTTDQPTGFSEILNALAKHSQLKVLNLNYTFCSITTKVAKDLADVIKNNLNLQHLGLDSVNLKPYAHVILQALAKSTKLEILNLNNNNMTGEVAEDLANVIANNPNLQHLGLGENKLGPSAVIILQTLAKCCKLELLNLLGIDLTELVAKDLENVIKNNPGLEYLYLSDNHLKTSAVVILKALKVSSLLRDLHLNDTFITEEATEHLADVIKNNTYLEELYIANNNLGVSGIVILQALTRTSKLKALNLNGNKLTGQVVEHLVSFIKNNSCLEKLYLSDNDFKSSVSAILKALKENSRLNILHLNGNLMTEEAAEDLADVIKSNAHLKQLCIANNKLGVSAAVILQALTRTSKLKALDLNGNKLTGQVVEHLVSVIKNNSCLEQLYLSDNDFKSSVSAIFKALKENSRLNILHLNGNVMTEEAAEDLADVIKSNAHLKQLSIANNKFGVSAAVILQALTRTSKLKALDLNGNKLTGQVVEHLVSVIKNNSHLEQLYLSYNDFKSSVSAILKALKENSRLHILHLNGNVMTEEAAEDLANVIKNNTHLKQLSIANNKLGVSAAVILQALTKTSKLECLNLNGSNLTGQVVEHLVSVIKNNSHLEQLYLSSNDFKSSVSTILKALKENSRLSILHLNDNVMTEEAAEDLADVIKNNTHLKQLCIKNNKLGVSAAVILQALRRTSSLKVLNLNGSNLTEQLVGDLINVIRNNLNLEELYLSNNDLHSSVFVILQALKENSELEILNLSSNNVTGLVVKDLISVIKFSSNLQQLALENNNLQLSSIMILQALKENCKLKVLNLDSNNMNGLVSKDLASVIKNNPSLEELHLSENNLKSSVIMIFHALKETSTLKVISLMSNNMTREVAGDLASVLKNNPNLEDLRIRNNYLGSSAVKLLQALTKISKLKTLSLISNNLTAEVSQDLAEVIRINSGLERFYLSDTKLKSSAVVILQALKQNSQLKKLHLQNFLTKSVIYELVSIIKSNPSITELWLGNNLLQSGLIDIAKTCNNLTNLHALELSCNNINSMEVFKLVPIIVKLNSLQVLVLGGLIFDVKERFCSHLCNIIKQKCLFQRTDIGNELLKGICLEMWRLQFAERIKLNHYSRDFFPKDMINVQMISFYTEKFSSTALSFVEQSEKKLSQLDATNIIISLSVIIKPLKVLDLEYSNIRKEAAVELATALNCNNVLEQLWLRGNVLGADGAAVILTSLQNITTLRVLDLSYNNISSRSAKGIASVINSNHFLEQLWLDGNMLMTTGVVIIASALKKHSNLTLLSLSNNEINEDAAEEISAIVNSNNLLGGLLLSNNQLQFTHLSEIIKSHGGIQFLHILELSKNLINATAADELSVTLTNCVCLKELYLGNNNLGTTGGVQIFQAVKNILILQVLSLNNNNITTEAASEICDVIIKNTNLDILLLGGNDLQTSGVLQIADTVKNNNPTMQLLSLSDNNVDEQVKEDIKVMLCDQCDLELFI